MTTTTWGDGMPPLTLDVLRDAMGKMLSVTPKPPMEFRVVPADVQCRTACDVPVAWVRPKPPSKRAGRRGTRKGWKRRNPPHMTFTYREPDDLYVISGNALRLFADERPRADIAIVTPSQMALIEAKTQEACAGSGAMASDRR